MQGYSDSTAPRVPTFACGNITTIWAIAARAKPSAEEGPIVAKKSVMPSVGDAAPPIDAATASGGHFSLAEQAGKWVVIFFYPMANTPG